MALLKFKRSAVPSKIPALTDLELGELAINTYDGKVYMRKDDGTASIIEVGGGGGVLSFNSRTGAVTLSSGDVTGALGYTPYNSSNPAGYIAGINSSMVTAALGYTPANRAGDTFTGHVIVSYGGSAYTGMAIKSTYASATNAATDFIDFVNEGGYPKVSIFGNIATDGSGYFQFLSTAPGVSRTSDTRTTTAYAYYNQWRFETASGIAASIYYDSNNTAYYLDPAATGISGMINGEVRFGGGGSSSVISADGDFYSRRKSSTGTGVYYFADGGSKYLYWDGSRYFFGDAGTIDTNQSFRAPIFYDLNDTSCYVDPNSTSWFKGNIYSWRPGSSNDVFGGIEIREASGVANAQTGAPYAPGINFHWSAIAAARIYMASNGAFVLGGQSDITNNRRSLFCSEIYATGNVIAYYSDERLKTRIGGIDGALGIVSKLSGFRYVNNELAKSLGYESDEVQLGVSAQEVEAVLPEVVSQAAFDIDINSPSGGSKTGQHYKTVQYDRLVPLLIEAIKELKAEVENLKAERV